MRKDWDKSMRELARRFASTESDLGRASADTSAYETADLLAGQFCRWGGIKREMERLRLIRRYEWFKKQIETSKKEVD